MKIPRQFQKSGGFGFGGFPHPDNPGYRRTGSCQQYPPSLRIASLAIFIFQISRKVKDSVKSVVIIQIRTQMGNTFNRLFTALFKLNHPVVKVAGFPVENLSQVIVILSEYLPVIVHREPGGTQTAESLF